MAFTESLSLASMAFVLLSAMSPFTGAVPTLVGAQRGMQHPEMESNVSTSAIDDKTAAYVRSLLTKEQASALHDVHTPFYHSRRTLDEQGEKLLQVTLLDSPGPLDTRAVAHSTRSELKRGFTSSEEDVAEDDVAEDE